MVWFDEGRFWDGIGCSAILFWHKEAGLVMGEWVSTMTFVAGI